MMQHIPDRGREEPENHHAHRDHQPLVRASAGPDAAQVEPGEKQREEQNPGRIGNRRPHIPHSLTAPDDADQCAEQQGQHIAPSREKAERGMDLTADISEHRPRAGIGARHASVTHGREQHRHHRDQDDGDDVSFGVLSDNSEVRHRRGRLDQNDAAEDQVPESQRAPKMGGRHEPPIVTVGQAFSLQPAFSRLPGAAVTTLSVFDL
jgi:hypothetical protein